MVQDLLFFGNLFGFFRCDVYFFFVFGRLLEIFNSFAKPFADLRQLPGTEDDQNNDQNDNQLRHSDSKHFFLLLAIASSCCEKGNPMHIGGSAWESNPPRTSLPVTGFEVQEAHQNLPTSIL